MLRKARFLIVDDSEIVRESVSRVLQHKIGVNTIYTAADGEEGMKFLEKKQVDIILSDWKMPKLSGEEFLFRVRNSEEWRDIPFIMMTVYDGRDFIVTAIQNGVSDYIVKPFSSAELEDKIRKCWNSARKREEERYSNLPPHQVMLKAGGTSYPGQFVDISRTGALIKMDYTDRLRLFDQYEISAEFEGDDSRPAWVVNPLNGTIVRLETETQFNPSSRVCYVALYFATGIIDRKVEKNLNELLKWLSSLNPNMIKDG